jgi:hypothetical protein
MHNLGDIVDISQPSILPRKAGFRIRRKTIKVSDLYDSTKRISDGPLFRVLASAV